MDNPQLFPETNEYKPESAAEITDLPESDTQGTASAARVSHTLLAWQRSIAQHPGRWRLISILSIGVLVLVIVAIIGNSLVLLLTPHPIATQSNGSFSFTTRTPFNPYNYPHTDRPKSIYVGLKGPVENLSWSPDGKRFAASAGIAAVWDKETGKEIVYQGHTDDVLGLAWSPDSQSIATASRDKTVQIWSAITGKRQQIIHDTLPVFSVAWSPDGKTLAFGDDAGQVHLWNVQAQREITTLTGQDASIFSLAWSPDGTELASGSLDRTVCVWQVSSKQLLWHYSHGDTITVVRWSPNGKYVASGSYDTTVQVWNAQHRTLIRTYENHNNAVLDLVWSQDSSRIASGGDDSTIQIWSISNGSPLMIFLTDTVSMDWSSDGRFILSGGRDGHITLWTT